MIKECVGDGNDLAEIIIDYEKKDVQILDAESRFKIKNRHLNFFPSAFNVFSFVVLSPFIALALFMNLYNISLFLGEMLITFYLLFVLFTPTTRKLHQLGQFLFNDFFKVKKYMVVKNIKSRVWKLPYEFDNIKLDYKLYKDYSKFIKKVHIKPKDYYSYRLGKPKRQTEEWDAYFYFNCIPKKGYMTIEWI